MTWGQAKGIRTVAGPTTSFFSLDKFFHNLEAVLTRYSELNIDMSGGSELMSLLPDSCQFSAQHSHNHLQVSTSSSASYLQAL